MSTAHSSNERPSIRSSWPLATSAACAVVRGNEAKNAAQRSSSYPRVGGSCHSTGPSLLPSARTPEAKKLASGASTSASFFRCVTNRGPLTANTNPSGVSSCQRWYDDGRWSE